MGGQLGPGILDSARPSLPAGDTASHQAPLKILVSCFKPKDLLLPLSLLCTPAGNQVRIASNSLPMIVFQCVFSASIPRVVRSSWKQLCEADVFSHKSPVMTQDVFLAKNLAPAGAVQALTPKALLDPASAGALVTPLMSLSQRLGFFIASNS